MALSVVDLYSKILPKTNCKDCGFSTCIAFAGMVVSEKYPYGKMKSLKEFPNTVSKIVSMRNHVEIPLINKFSSNTESLESACKQSGGKNVKFLYDSPDLAFEFSVFPKIPVVLLFWDEDDGFEADVKLLFDETIIQHLDIESIMFLSEHLCNMLIGAGEQG